MYTYSLKFFPDGVRRNRLKLFRLVECYSFLCTDFVQTQLELVQVFTNLWCILVCAQRSQQRLQSSRVFVFALSLLNLNQFPSSAGDNTRTQPFRLT